MKRFISSRKILSLICLLFLVAATDDATAQSKEKVILEEKVYTEVDKPAEFPGGLDSLANYIGSNLNYPEDAKKHGIQGRVFASFIVDRNGKIKNVEIIKGLSPSCNEEVSRILNAMPDWIPAELNGIQVSMAFTLPVTFRL